MTTAATALLALLSAALPEARADDELSPDEEEELGELAEEDPPAPAARPAATSMNPDLSFVLDTAFAWFSADEPLQTGGHDPSKNGFNLQQLEMSIGKAVDPYFRFDGNVVLSQFGVEIEEAYATTLELPHGLQARIGQFLTRFGRINPTHPHAWDFVDQPLAIGRVFGGEGNRGLGAELSWLAPISRYLELLVSVTDPVGEGTARSFFGAEDLGLQTPLDLQATVAAKTFFELGPNWSLLTGLSWAEGPNPTGHDNRTEVYGIDLYLKYRPITFGSHTIVALQTEWLYRRQQVPGDIQQDVDGYAQLFWRFWQRTGAAVRWEYGSPAWDRDRDRVTDRLDPFWTDHRQRVSANLTFWPTEFSRIRLQGQVDAPGWQARPDVAGFLAFEFVVGAHGAHKF